MTDTIYSFGTQGAPYFIRAASEIQGNIVEPFFDSDGWQYDRWYFDHIPALSLHKQPTALGGMQVAGIVFGFLATCFAEKIFDEFYDRLLARPIGNFIDKLLEKLDIPPSKSFEYLEVIYFKDIDVTVVIRITMGSNNGQEIQRQVMQAHRVAHNYIEKHGRKAPIHCHAIVDGKVALEPELFATLEQLKSSDRDKIKIMGHNDRSQTKKAI